MNLREKRYFEKIKLIEKRMGEINKWKNDFFRDEKTRLACYKALQEIIEASMDVCSMVLKDEKELPKDDYSNIEILQRKEFFSKETADSLRQLNGLRNRIVHQYNGLDDRIALSSSEELFPHVAEFLMVIKKWLKKRM